MSATEHSDTHGHKTSASEKEQVHNILVLLHIKKSN